MFIIPTLITTVHRIFLFWCMIEIIEAGEAHIPVIADIAEKTWAKTYTEILSSSQIRFMLDAMYSGHALTETMRTRSQHFLLLKDNGTEQGFVSFAINGEKPEICKIHKLYVLPDNQGKGFGRTLIEEVKKRAQVQGATSLELNVNRYNPARYFYEKLEFRIIREEDIPIGPYWMNDYVMRLKI